MDFSSNYLTREKYIINNNQNIPLYYSLNRISPLMMKRKKISANTLNTKYSLSSNDIINLNSNNKIKKKLISRRILHRDFHIKNHIRQNNSKFENKNITQDLDMMKIQLRCDLITQKINQIQNQVQTLHESNIQDDLNILNKNKNDAYENIYEYNNINKNYKSMSNREKFILIKRNNFSIEPKEKIDFYKIANNCRNINADRANSIDRETPNMFYNSYNTNQSNSNNYKINNYNQINQAKKNKMYLKSFLLNSINKGDISAPNIQKKYLNFNKPKIRYRQNNFNEINSFNNKSSDIYNISNALRNKNKIKQNLKYCFNANHKRKGTDIAYNYGNIDYNLNIINENENNSNNNKYVKNENVNDSPDSIRYGSFDKYFYNDNNYADSKFLKYIQNINNNFSPVNYKNLDELKKNTFNHDELEQITTINKMLNRNYLIRNDNNINKDENTINNLNKPKMILKNQFQNLNKIQIENENENKINTIDKMNQYFNGDIFKNYNSCKNKDGMLHIIDVNNFRQNNKNKNDISNNKVSLQNYKKNVNKISVLRDKPIVIEKNKENNKTFEIENKITSFYNSSVNTNNTNTNTNSNTNKNNKVDDTLTSKYEDNENDNINFKININNVSNYSIKNNCLNINKNRNKNSQNSNNNRITSNKLINDTDINDEKIYRNRQINHDYSNDDMLPTQDILISLLDRNSDNKKRSKTYEINKENSCEFIAQKITSPKNLNKIVNKEDTNNKNNNNRINCSNYKVIKNNQTNIKRKENQNLLKKQKKFILKLKKPINKSKIESYLDKKNKTYNNNNISEEINYNAISYNNISEGKIKDISQTQNSKNSNIINSSQKKDLLNSTEIPNLIKLKNKNLCHKFINNPQNFYTVKLTESMLKQLIKIKKKKLKK